MKCICWTLLVTGLLQSAAWAMEMKQRTRPLITTAEKFSRKELMQLWKDMNPDPEADKSETSGGVMGKGLRIIGGKEATRGQFPWQAAMVLDSENFCGGSLISVSHVLSAAHCAEGVQEFSILLGGQNKDEYEANRQTFRTTEKVIHPKWDTLLVRNDISIITLPRPAEMNEYIKVVRLPRKSWTNRMLVKFKGVVSGFGRTSDNNPNVSAVLNQVSMRVVPTLECVRLYGKDSVSRNNLCLRGIGGKDRGTCNGDSGGPFVVQERDGEWTQVGIVSYGAATGCGKGYPDVMTRVMSFIPFIESNTRIKLRS